MFGNQSERRAHVRDDDGAAAAKGGKKIEKERGKTISSCSKRWTNTSNDQSVQPKHVRRDAEGRLQGLVVGCRVAEREGQRREGGWGGGMRAGEKVPGVLRQAEEGCRPPAAAGSKRLALSSAGRARPVPQGSHGTRSSKRKFESACAEPGIVVVVITAVPFNTLSPMTANALPESRLLLPRSDPPKASVPLET